MTPEEQKDYENNLPDEKDEETLLAESQEWDESDNYRGDR